MRAGDGGLLNLAKCQILGAVKNALFLFYEGKSLAFLTAADLGMLILSVSLERWDKWTRRNDRVRMKYEVTEVQLFLVRVMNLPRLQLSSIGHRGRAPLFSCTTFCLARRKLSI